MPSIKIEVTARTNRVGSESSTTFNVDKEEFESMDEVEETLLHEISLCMDHIQELVEWNWEVVE